MLLLLEEIAVEAVMIAAILVALGVLVWVLVGFALEYARTRQEAVDHSFATARSHSSVGRHA